ncbi:MAG TPA: YMGG-like glycine zipper-containing protein [Geminicoccaceae bacterium]|nr:YMGG-like glycine zipper-containing protein [Geminicoccaceae bacterium]
MSSKKLTVFGACVGALLLLGACGESVQQRAATGGLGGAAAGAMVGGPVGAVVGGGAGAATGAVLDEGVDETVRDATN